MFVEDINKSRRMRLVSNDKFDRHMRHARLGDIISRKKIFSLQTEVATTRNEARKCIKPSIY